MHCLKISSVCLDYLFSVSDAVILLGMLVSLVIAIYEGLKVR